MSRSQTVRRFRGFTLIELLVVVAIVAVLAGMVGTSFIGSGRHQSMEGFAHRMAQRVELARDRALQRNKEWGLYVSEGEYEFAEFDEANQTWEPYALRPFNAEAFAADVLMEAEVEEYEGQVGAEDDALPDIIFFSSGEVTPFELSMHPIGDLTRVWLLDSDGFSRVRAKLKER